MKIYDLGIHEVMPKITPWAIADIFAEQNDIHVLTTASEETVLLGREHPIALGWKENQYGVPYIRVRCNGTAFYLNPDVRLAVMSLPEGVDANLNVCAGILRDVVRELGVGVAEVSNNDLILVDGKKIGAVGPYVVNGKTAMVLGVTFRMDYDRVDEIIQVRKRGHTSVRQRATQLADYLDVLPTDEEFHNAVLKVLTRTFTPTEVETSALTDEMQKRISEHSRNFYENDEWVKYGRSFKTQN